MSHVLDDDSDDERDPVYIPLPPIESINLDRPATSKDDSYELYGFRIPKDWFFEYLQRPVSKNAVKSSKTAHKALGQLIRDTGIYTLILFPDDNPDNRFLVVYKHDPNWPRRFFLGKETFEEIPDYEAKYQHLLKILNKKPGTELEVKPTTIES